MQIPVATQAHLPPWRAVRIAQGKGLRETAKKAAIDATHLSRVERGQKQLSVDAMYRLAGVLELRDLQRLLSPYVVVESSSSSVQKEPAA